MQSTFEKGSKANQRLMNTRIYGCPEYWQAVKRVVLRGHGHTKVNMPLRTARGFVDYAWFELIFDRARKGLKTEACISRAFLNKIANA